MIIINLIILIGFALILLKSKGYDRELIETLDSKEFKLKSFFPAGLYILDKVTRFKQDINFSKQEESLKAIHIGEPINRVKRIYLCKKIVIVGLVVFVFNTLSIFAYISTISSSSLDKNIILRPGSHEETKTISLDVYITKEDLLVLTEEIELEIQGKRYSKEELNDLIIEAKDYIDASLLKENKSLNEVRGDIYLTSHVPGTGLSIKWERENNQLINREGKVNNGDLKEAVSTWVLASIQYFDLQVEYKIDLLVLPRLYTEEELAYQKLLEEISKSEESSKTQDSLELPSSIGEMDVIWEEKKESLTTTFIAIGIVAAVLVFWGYDKDLYAKVEERNRQMLLDYPEIIDKITLLLGAGMPLANAWHKIVLDYKGKKTNKRYAYEEMIITSNELMLGKSEIAAYESFGRRVKLLPYLRFSSLLAQNVRKGSSDLLRTLELEAIESFEERKELAKRIGEEAGTKLLFPMMLMLLIVLIIVIVPAFLSFQL